MESYGERDAYLFKMGYRSFSAYLASPLWKSIEEKGFAHHGRVCSLCRSPATILHHLGYGESVLEGKTFYQFVPLCQDCYLTIEYTEHGNRRTLMNCQKAYQAAKRHSKQSKETGKRKCRGCGKSPRKGYLYCRPCERGNEEIGQVQIIPRDTVQVTEELLDRGKSRHGAWSRVQVTALGVRWPLESGWRRKLIGSFVTAEGAATFLILKDMHLLNQREERRKWGT